MIRVLALTTAALAAALWLHLLGQGGAQRLHGNDAASALTNGGTAAEGRRVIEAKGCAACHEIPGVRVAHGKIGPPLTGFADRVMIAGVLANSPENLMRWIRDPRKIDPR